MTLLELISTDVPRKPSSQERFMAFHHANPPVYAELRKLALELVDVGHERIGIGMLWEVLRWQRALTTTDEAYKLNNNLRSRYARLLMDTVPELAGRFETRQIHEGRAFLVRKS